MPWNATVAGYNKVTHYERKIMHKNTNNNRYITKKKLRQKYTNAPHYAQMVHALMEREASIVGGCEPFVFSAESKKKLLLSKRAPNLLNTHIPHTAESRSNCHWHPPLSCVNFAGMQPYQVPSLLLRKAAVEIRSSRLGKILWHP